MVTECREWKRPVDMFSPLCTNEMFPLEGQRSCPVCVSPQSNSGICANCLVPPPIAYTLDLVLVPLRTITYYPWNASAQAAGLVESTVYPGFAEALVNDGSHYPGNCGYSTRYNLIQTGPCEYESDELEVVVLASTITSGGVNRSPVYDIQCRNVTIDNPGYNRRKRVKLLLENHFGHIEYRLLVAFVLDHADPQFILNRATRYQIEYVGHALNRDCNRPVVFARTGPLPFVAEGLSGPPAFIWSMSFMPGYSV